MSQRCHVIVPTPYYSEHSVILQMTIEMPLHWYDRPLFWIYKDDSVVPFQSDLSLPGESDHESEHKYHYRKKMIPDCKPKMLSLVQVLSKLHLHMPCIIKNNIRSIYTRHTECNHSQGSIKTPTVLSFSKFNDLCLNKMQNGNASHDTLAYL